MNDAEADADDTVQIGAAATLFDLPPSTLRWWEQAGVLARPLVERGRRRYREDDLRRIGLAYICHVVGMMPLADTATVTSADHGHIAWQHAVRTQVDRLDRQRERIDDARRHLQHLLHCTDDDPVADCPFLAAELVARTPRGRIAEADLIQAARMSEKPRSTGDHGAAHAPTAPRTARPAGDEKHGDGRRRDEIGGPTTGPPVLSCQICREPMAGSGRGRPRRYCSAACRQRAYRSRRPGPGVVRLG